MIAFLRSEQPDILVAQEVYAGDDQKLPPNYRSLAEISRALDLPHTFFSPTFRDLSDVGAIEQGNAIFSHFPILETRTMFFDVPYNPSRVETPDSTFTPRNLQHAVVDVQGTVLNVFNTQGIWGFDGNDNPRRLAMADAIAKEIQGKPRVILAGDLNVQEGTEAIQKIEAHLTNVFKGGLTSSFNLRHKPGNPFASAIVDFVFVSADLRVLAHRAPDVDVSDHRPLVCEFEIA